MAWSYLLPDHLADFTEEELAEAVQFVVRAQVTGMDG
jgi:hypothetical protein